MTRTASITFAAAALLCACAEKTPQAPATPASAGQRGAASAAPSAPASARPTPKAPPKVAATPSAPAQAKPYRPPAVARALSAAHTQVVVGVEGLDWLFRNLARVQAQVLPALPAETLAELPPQLKDPKFLPKALGFAPETPAGWQGVGVQPGAGLSLVIDDRLVVGDEPRPVFAAQITDQGKFLNFLNAMERRHGPGKGVTLTGKAEGGCKFLQISDKQACLGTHRGVTFMMPLPASRPERRAAMVKAFGAIVSDAGPTLMDAPDFKAGLRAYPGTPAAFAWVDHKLSAQLWAKGKAEGGALPPDVAFFLDRFPASAVWYGRRGGGMRLSADPAGAAALAQILRPKSAPPPLAHLMGPRTAFQRFALNLPTLFEGISALVPPSRGQVKGQILLAKNMIPVATGVAWEDLAGGLTGHITALIEIPESLPPKQPKPDSIVVALGVLDAEKAQRALDGALRKLGQANPAMLGPKTKVAGREVQPVGPMQVVALIDGQLLYVGVPAAVERALAAKHAPPALVGQALQSDAFLTFGMPSEAILGAVELPPNVNAETVKLFWDGILTDGYFVGGLRVDDHGLTSTSGGGAVMLTGVLAAIAIPAFMKYIRRSKASMARVTVMSLAQAVEMYKLEKGEYPPSAPLTPPKGDGPCFDGSDRYAITADTFAHPTWKALPYKFPEGNSYYRFELVNEKGAVTVRAVGDLDCDGVYSTFERRTGGGELRVENELE